LQDTRLRADVHALPHILNEVIRNDDLSGIHLFIILALHTRSASRGIGTSEFGGRAEVVDHADLRGGVGEEVVAGNVVGDGAEEDADAVWVTAEGPAVGMC
jgi:hypothetical protein